MPWESQPAERQRYDRGREGRLISAPPPFLPERTFEQSTNRHGAHMVTTPPCYFSFLIERSLVAAKPRFPARQAGPTLYKSAAARRGTPARDRLRYGWRRFLLTSLSKRARIIKAAFCLAVPGTMKQTTAVPRFATTTTPTTTLVFVWRALCSGSLNPQHRNRQTAARNSAGRVRSVKFRSSSCVGLASSSW